LFKVEQIRIDLDSFEDEGVVEWVKTGDVLFFDGTIDIDELADNFVANVESFGREELGAIFAFVDFVLAPDSFERFVFDVLGVSGGLADVEKVPNGFEFAFADVGILDEIGDDATTFPVFVEESVGRGEGFGEHEPEHESDIFIDFLQVVIIFEVEAFGIEGLHESFDERGDEFVVDVIALPSLSIDDMAIFLIVEDVGIVYELDAQLFTHPPIALVSLLLVQDDLCP
jgi:hypothetical protein